MTALARERLSLDTMVQQWTDLYARLLAKTVIEPADDAQDAARFLLQLEPKLRSLGELEGKLAWVEGEARAKEALLGESYRLRGWLRRLSGSRPGRAILRRLGLRQ